MRGAAGSLDATEPSLGGEHPGGGPAQRHLAVLPVRDASRVVACSTALPTDSSATGYLWVEIPPTSGLFGLAGWFRGLVSGSGSVV